MTIDRCSRLDHFSTYVCNPIHLLLLNAQYRCSGGEWWPPKEIGWILFPIRFAVRVPMVHVLTERTRMREFLQTFLALEWLLAGMQSLVFGQMVLVFKCFWTILTFVWTLTCAIDRTKTATSTWTEKRNEKKIKIN